MSFGVHRIWKDTLMQELNPSENVSLLDVAGGTGNVWPYVHSISSNFEIIFVYFVRITCNWNCARLDIKLFAGDIAFRFLKYKDGEGSGSSRTVTVCDINQDMLDVGKERADHNKLCDHNISWVCGDAENLPFEDNTFCAYTIAFGIRNCTHINKVWTISQYCQLPPRAITVHGGYTFCSVVPKFSDWLHLYYAHARIIISCFDDSYYGNNPRFAQNCIFPNGNTVWLAFEMLRMIQKLTASLLM